MSNTTKCIQNMDNAINKVNEAKNYLKEKGYQNAENSMVDNIQSIIDALNCINGHNQSCQCDNTGAIALTATTDLQNGNKYITPSGAVITWMGNTITVCEPGIPPDIWSVNGSPFIINDVTGKVQQIPTPNAMIYLEDGSSLLVGTNEIGDITKARHLKSGEHLSPLTNLEGYPTKQTELYSNDANRSKIETGTVYSAFGI